MMRNKSAIAQRHRVTNSSDDDSLCVGRGGRTEEYRGAGCGVVVGGTIRYTVVYVLHYFKKKVGPFLFGAGPSTHSNIRYFINTSRILLTLRPAYCPRHHSHFLVDSFDAASSKASGLCYVSCYICSTTSSVAVLFLARRRKDTSTKREATSNHILLDLHPMFSY